MKERLDETRHLDEQRTKEISEKEMLIIKKTGKIKRVEDRRRKRGRNRLSAVRFEERGVMQNVKRRFQASMRT